MRDFCLGASLPTHRPNANWRPSMRHLKLACEDHAARKASNGRSTRLPPWKPWVAFSVTVALVLAGVAAARGQSLPVPWEAATTSI